MQKILLLIFFSFFPSLSPGQLHVTTHTNMARWWVSSEELQETMPAITVAAGVSRSVTLAWWVRAVRWPTRR